MKPGDSYLIFELGHAAYGLRSADVLYVEMLESITPVPNTAAPVEGIVFSRGNLYPALNLRVRFGLERTPPTSRTRLIFVQVQQRTVALMVDSAREFHVLAPDAMRPIEPARHGLQGSYVEGVATLGGRMVLLLDVISVLNLDDPAPLLEAAAVADSPLP